MTEPADFQLDAELKRRIQEVARVFGISPTELMRRALEWYESGGGCAQPPPRSGQESVLDALKRIGVIGCVKGGPADLSTHPRHMNGFGEIRNA